MLVQYASADNVEISALLISERTGIITDCRKIEKSLSEPELPHLFMASLCNVSQVNDPQQRHYGWGKGMSAKLAQLSALGEAIETYAALKIIPGDIIFSDYNHIGTDGLDPRSLVLYLKHQYEELPFIPFKQDLEIGWVKAFSLTSNKQIYVPAESVFLRETHEKTSCLFEITSSGMATATTMLQSIVSASIETNRAGSIYYKLA